MKVYNFKPGVALAGYVDRILVIEHCENSTPFSLPMDHQLYFLSQQKVA